MTLQSVGVLLILVATVWLLLTAWRDRALGPDGEFSLAMVALALALFLWTAQ